MLHEYVRSVVVGKMHVTGKPSRRTSPDEDVFQWRWFQTILNDLEASTSSSPHVYTEDEAAGVRRLLALTDVKRVDDEGRMFALHIVGARSDIANPAFVQSAPLFKVRAANKLPDEDSGYSCHVLVDTRPPKWKEHALVYREKVPTIGAKSVDAILNSAIREWVSANPTKLTNSLHPDHSGPFFVKVATKLLPNLKLKDAIQSGRAIDLVRLEGLKAPDDMDNPNSDFVSHHLTMRPRTGSDTPLERLKKICLWGKLKGFDQFTVTIEGSGPKSVRFTDPEEAGEALLGEMYETAPVETKLHQCHQQLREDMVSELLKVATKHQKMNP